MSDYLIIPASSFLPSEEIISISPLGEGNIHESFIVKARDKRSYLLQHKNKIVFRDIPAMMENILKVTTHLKRKASLKGLDPLKHSLTIIPTSQGKLFYLDESGEYWTMCILIDEAVTYHNPLNSDMAFSGGQGTGEFHNDLADFNESLTDILPGFHNMRFRYQQWDQVIQNISATSKSKYSREIVWIESRREEMLGFRTLFETGQIPVRVAHNDAKLANILFDRKGNSLCLIDLDTVLNGSIFYDFGDAIRTYTNTGAEDDVNPENVKMNIEFFKAFTSGYIQQASGFITNIELENLAFAARYITFEQVLRFLMDYLDGNKYYRISHPEHNLQRTLAQYALLLDMEKHYRLMNNLVFEIYNKVKS